ncbi:MAG: outer membrane lipoprotein-sorting protein [Spirochaetes bacterium]|nr:outer membrane lipoprotein-sorting protein [Spirochaetota bacterium]
MLHITPDGKSGTIELVAYISDEAFHFRFSTNERGEEIRVLYNLNGEDIWVYNIHSIILFNKRGIDKFDSILRTNFYYLDLSNYDLQSNYNAEITGDAFIKGNDCYKLDLKPILQGGIYGLLTLYADKKDYVPLRIDFHDKDKVVMKTMSIVKVAQREGKTIPLRYDMLDIRKGTITLLEFYKFDRAMTFEKKLFRHENLEEK